MSVQMVTSEWWVYFEQLGVIGPWFWLLLKVHRQLHLRQVHTVVVGLQDLLELGKGKTLELEPNE